MKIILPLHTQNLVGFKRNNFMPVKIRLAKRGRKKLAFYHIVVTDSRAPRDGKSIERIGSYNPLTNPATIELNFDRALDWLQKGAQPTDTCRSILSSKGVLYKKHLLEGVKKGAFNEEEAELRFQRWISDKLSKEKTQVDKLAKGKEEEAKKRFEAETKVREAKAEILAKKLKAEAEAREEGKAEEQAKAEAETEVKAEAQAETEVKVEAKAETKAKVETEAKVVTEAETEAKVETKAETEAKVETKAETEAKVETKAENAKAKTGETAEMKPKAEAKAGAESKAENKVKAEKETEAEPKAEAEKKAVTKDGEAAKPKKKAKAKAEDNKTGNKATEISDETPAE
jgi:small subunit ribosomal protein S16